VVTGDRHTFDFGEGRGLWPFLKTVPVVGSPVYMGSAFVKCWLTSLSGVESMLMNQQCA